MLAKFYNPQLLLRQNQYKQRQVTVKNLNDIIGWWPTQEIGDAIMTGHNSLLTEIEGLQSALEAARAEIERKDALLEISRQSLNASNVKLKEDVTKFDSLTQRLSEAETLIDELHNVVPMIFNDEFNKKINDYRNKRGETK